VGNASASCSGGTRGFKLRYGKRYLT
jgi:hypothetical protein